MDFETDPGSKAFQVLSALSSFNNLQFYYRQFVNFCGNIRRDFPLPFHIEPRGADQAPRATPMGYSSNH